ncbi:hypothetical protein BD311DRAFT_603973, partial [Dichomitus squalens]
MYAQRIVDADDLDGEADGLSQQILQQQSGPEDMPGEVQGDVDDDVDLPESDYDAYHLDYDSPEDEPDWDDDEGRRDEFYVMRAEPVFATPDEEKEAVPSSIEYDAKRILQSFQLEATTAPTKSLKNTWLYDSHIRRLK